MGFGILDFGFWVNGRQRGANGRQRGPTGDNDWVTDFGAANPHFFVRIRKNEKNIGGTRGATLGSQILEPADQILVSRRDI